MKEDPTAYQNCVLMLDAMALKQHVDYNNHTGKTVGFVNLGDGSDTTDEAKEALVFLVVGLRGHWKMPVAFFFTRTLTGFLFFTFTACISHTLQSSWKL